MKTFSELSIFSPKESYIPETQQLALPPEMYQPCYSNRMGESDSLSHPFPHLGNAAVDSELQRRISARKSCTGCSPALHVSMASGSVPSPDPAQGVSTSLVPSSTMHATPVCSSTLGHAFSPFPQGIKGSYLPPCGPPGPPDSRALLPASTALHSSPVLSGASGFVPGQWGKVGKR